MVELFVALECVGPAVLEEKETGLSCSCGVPPHRLAWCEMLQDQLQVEVV